MLAPCLCVALILTSCETTSPSRDSSTKSKAVLSETREKDASKEKPGDTSHYWYAVSTDPIVYAPVGHSSRSPRSYWDGEWVVDKVANTKWFIPYGGTRKRTAEELTASAFSLRSRSTRAKAALRQSARATGEFTLKSSLTALVIGGSMLGGGAGGADLIEKIWE